MNAAQKTSVMTGELEGAHLLLPMRERLRLAALRMREAEQGIVMRPAQEGVIEDGLDYFEDVANRPDDGPSPYARIILPPRTGKTVVAAKFIELSGLITVYVTSTITLAEQAFNEFRKRLPQTPVGILTGKTKELPEEYGVLVTTYSMLHVMQAKGEYPPAITSAALIFVDEAHHAMTERRTHILQNAVDPSAIRIALTATPDYDEERILAKYFPELIHEITIQEGVEMGLLSKVRAFACAVDVGASEVRIIAGDYEKEDLGLVMSRTPMLKLVEMIRYDAVNRDIPTLITCSSRAQALCVFAFLEEYRPAGTPCPAVILGSTDHAERRTSLRLFDEGEIDTLITVGVLIEGWDSPRCKLLIDLAPTLSDVRAAQKYARVMTVDGDAEAKIYILQPDGLTRMPVLPMDVFGPSSEALLARDTLPNPTATHTSGARRDLWARIKDSGIAVASVTARWRIVEEHRIDRIQLRRGDQEAVEKLVRTSGLYPPTVDFAGLSRFMTARFLVGDVGVRGSQLLRFLGFASTLRGYQAFISRYFPDVYTDRILLGANWKYYEYAFLGTKVRMDQRPTVDEDGEEILPPEPIHVITIAEMEESCQDRFRREYHRMGQEGSPNDIHVRRASAYDMGLAAVCGERFPDPETVPGLVTEKVRKLLDELTPREARILRWHYGIDGEEYSTQEIADRCGISRARVHDLRGRAEAKISRALQSEMRTAELLSSLHAASSQKKMLELYAFTFARRKGVNPWKEQAIPDNASFDVLPPFSMETISILQDQGNAYAVSCERACVSAERMFGWLRIRKYGAKHREIFSPGYRVIENIRLVNGELVFRGIRSTLTGPYQWKCVSRSLEDL